MPASAAPASQAGRNRPGAKVACHDSQRKSQLHPNAPAGSPADEFLILLLRQVQEDSPSTLFDRLFQSLPTRKVRQPAATVCKFDHLRCGSEVELTGKLCLQVGLQELALPAVPCAALARALACAALRNPSAILSRASGDMGFLVVPVAVAALATGKV